MVRLILAVFVTIVVVVYSMANMHHVPVSFVFGPPIHMPMIFLLVVAYTGGLLTAFFYALLRSVTEDRKRKELQKRKQGTDLLDPRV